MATISGLELGTSIPTVPFPGIGAIILIPKAAKLRAISSSKFLIFEILTPGAGITSSTSLLNERREAETSKYYVPTISAVGFSSIAIQPSKSLNQRRLMAMRAAKLDAYRSLTEQIHGIYIQGETTVGEAVLTSDKLGAALRGTVMGARTVKIEPTGSDTYQVELSVSQTHVDRLIKSYRRGLL